MRIVKILKSSIEKFTSLIEYIKNDEANLSIFTPYQVEVFPTRNKKAIVLPTDDNGYQCIVAEELITEIKEGELKVKAIDPTNNNQVISSIYLQLNSDIVFKNNAGLTTIKADGSITFANGATITASGDIITASGISLEKHTHVLNDKGQGYRGAFLTGETGEAK